MDINIVSGHVIISLKPERQDQALLGSGIMGVTRILDLTQHIKDIVKEAINEIDMDKVRHVSPRSS